jgi:hypothetical protein
MTDETFQIQVPAVDWNGKAADMRSRLMTWEWRWKLPAKYRALSIDFRRVSFMEPWALAMFAAYGMRMRESGVRVTAELDPANPSNIYFSDMGLKTALETGSNPIATAHWSESHQNTGLHVIKTYADLQEFLRSSSRLTLAHCEDAADALKYVMSELSRNVLQHAHSEIGGVAIAQHCPEQGRLQVRCATRVAAYHCRSGIVTRNFAPIWSAFELQFFHTRLVQDLLRCTGAVRRTLGLGCSTPGRSRGAQGGHSGSLRARRS